MFHPGRKRGMYKRENMAMRNVRKLSSPTNTTTADSQYEKEQRILEAKRMRRLRLSDTRRIAICGSKVEKVNSQRVVKKSLDELMTKKRLADLGEKAEDKKIIDHSVSKEAAIFERERKKKLEKKLYLKKMMEENKRMVKMRSIQKVEEKKEDVERAKKVEFFDRYKTYL